MLRTSNCHDSSTACGTGPYGRNGPVVRVVYLGLAILWRLWMLLPGQSRLRWIVLCYHAVRPSQLKRFENQMQRLAGHVVSVDQIGSGQPGICLTFDDAFACLLDNVIPLASRFDVPVAIFPVTENLDASPRWDMPAGHPERDLRTMSEEELLSLRDHPLVTIGSHTATHPRLGDVHAVVVLKELASSRDSLAQLLAIAPVDLALPHGSHNSFVCETAREQGYRRIFTLEPKIIFHSSPDGRLGRFSVDPDMWMIEFQLTVAGAYSYLFPLRNAIRRIRLWSAGLRLRAVKSQPDSHAASGLL